ncbi:YSIRK-type signal peptide-containing protein [Gemella cuniculi]|uniref:YSIRK-type signal peptide-containing protein n=1 Tax=Gemella cuniculi TaxID=150240 RepID=UPI00041D1F32|nr:YSIRK-type signal peptide-containing protein [Gemella cuniculi]
MVKYDQKFSIRKVSVGAASIVIGLAAGGAIAYANEIDVKDIPMVVHETRNSEIEKNNVLGNEVKPKLESSLEKPMSPGSNKNAEEVTKPTANKEELNTAIEKSNKENMIFLKKDEIRKRAYSIYNSQKYIEKLENANTLEELEKISLDLEKDIFLENLHNIPQNKADELRVKTEKITAKGELERLKVVYEEESNIERERSNLKNYISSKLNDINEERRDFYFKKIDSINTSDVLERIKEEVKLENRENQNSRIEREKLNISNIMEYVEVLSIEQKEYIKKEMEYLYTEEYKDKAIEKQDKNNTISPNKTTRDKVQYSIGDTNLESFILTKIHYLSILNEHPYFEKEDFANLREKILKAKYNSREESLYDNKVKVNKFFETKQLSRLEDDEKEILKNKILKLESAEYNRGFRDLYYQEDYINSLDFNKFLSTEEIEKYRKKLLAANNIEEIKNEINLLKTQKSLEIIKRGLSEKEKDQIEKIAKVDSIGGLLLAEEYKKINSYKNITQEDKNFFKSQVKYIPSSSNYLSKRIPEVREPIDILDKLYTLASIPQDIKEELRKEILRGVIIKKHSITSKDIEDYNKYYARKIKIANPNLSEETRKYLSDKLENFKKEIDIRVERSAKTDRKNDLTITRMLPDILGIQIRALEKLFDYKHIPQYKKLIYEKEIISSEDLQEINNLMAMNRALEEMLDIKNHNISNSKEDDNIGKTIIELENNDPTEKEKENLETLIRKKDSKIEKDFKEDVPVDKKDKLNLMTNLTDNIVNNKSSGNEIYKENSKEENEVSIVTISKNLDDREIVVAYNKNSLDVDGLYLEKIEDKSIAKLVVDKLGKTYKVLEVFEMHFEKGNREIESNILRTVSITLVENDGEVEIYHITKNRELEKITSEKIGDKVYFTTNHFSKFTLVQNNKKVHDLSAVVGIGINQTQSSSTISVNKNQLPKAGEMTSSLAGLSTLTLLVALLLVNRKNVN